MKLRHSGDLGDIVYSLAIVAELGGTHDMLLVDRPFTKPLKHNFLLIEALLRIQPYIKSVEFSEEKPDIDFSIFRKHHKLTQSLVKSMRDSVNEQAEIKLKTTGNAPWLTAGKSSTGNDRVIVARSKRYNNPYFRWKEIVQHYGDRILFVGIDHEYKDFCSSFGKVDRMRVLDYGELACLINGSELFIGNQSSPMSVAIGLGKPFIQESCLWQPDCIFDRENGQFVANGDCVLPSVAGSEELDLRRNREMPIRMNTALVPPGGWQYEGLPNCCHFTIQSRIVARKDKCNIGEASKRLIEFNYKRVPGFFDLNKTSDLDIFNSAKNLAIKQ